MNASRLALVPACLLALPAAAQLTVGPPGSGAQFAEIADAVAASVPGDTILVEPGSYAEFAVGHALTIVGAGSDQTIVAQGSSAPGIQVSGIAAGAEVRLAGLGFGTSAGTQHPHVELTQIDGRIVVTDLEVRDQILFGFSAPNAATVVVEDCDEAVFIGCTIDGFHAGGSPPSLNGSDALRATRSSVWLVDSALKGAFGGSQFNNGGTGGEGLLAEDSTVYLARSTVTGGAGGVFWAFDPLLTYGFPGAAGALLANSVLVVSGGPENRIEGGPGPLVDDDNWYPGGPAVSVGATSSFFAAADVDLVPGENGDGTPAVVTVKVFTGGSFTTGPNALPTIALDPPLAAPGDPIAVAVSGTPATAQVPFASFSLAAPTIPAGFAEPVWLAAALAAPLPAITTDASGAGQLDTALPPAPALVGLAVFVQSFESGPGGIALSNPGALAVRP